jgi:hypothetical protein
MVFAPSKARKALHSMKNGESDYLNPLPLKPAQVKSIYGPSGKEEDHERQFGRAAFAAVRRASRG